MTDLLYREEILEHYKDPQNFGALEACDITSRQLNPFCGDDIQIYVKYRSEKVSEIRFTGKGCALAIAAASILTEFAKGKKKKELALFSEDDMLRLLGIEVSETRKKCALLPLVVLKDCL